MEVVIKDSDLVSLVLGFLHSRQLYESALALERETGCLMNKDESLPEDLRFLRQLSLDGDWELVLSYAEPFTHLEEFNTKLFYYLVLRQRYFEALHSYSLSKSRSFEDTAALKGILESVRPYCSQEEFQQLSQARNHSDLHDWSVVASRFRCFNDILLLIGPLYEDDGVGVSEGASSQYRSWIQEQERNGTCNRLQSLVTNALFYNECSKYCKERALGTEMDAADLPWISSQSLDRIDAESPVNAALLFWLRSLNNSNLFQQQFEEVDVEVKVEQLQKRTTPRDLQTSMESKTKLSSFASSMQPTTQNYSKTNAPSMTQSVQLPSSERIRSQHNVLSASGPARHAYGGRNYSNNNNNETSASTHEPPTDFGYQTSSTHPKMPKDGPLKNEHDKSDEIPPTHPSLVVQNGVLHEGGATGKVLSKDGGAVSKTHKKQDPSNYEKQENEFVPSPPNVPTSGDPENLYSDQMDNGCQDTKVLGVNDVSHAHSQHLEGYPVSAVKVDDSYAEFEIEKRRLQVEKQNFLKELEEKEKKNEEIRKMLIEGSPSSKVPEPLNEPSVDATRKDVNANHPPPIKAKYVPIEVTEDNLAIRAVAFHTSGMVYAVGSNSKTLRICEVPRDIVSRYIRSSRSAPLSGEQEDIEMKPSNVLIKRSRLHKGSIYSIAWNADGSLIATGSNDKLIKLQAFDILGKKLDETPQEMSFHRGIVRDVHFLHQSRNLLASGGGDGTVHISDCTQKDIVQHLPGHSDHILSLISWSPQMLASSSQDKSIRLWDVRASRCVSIIGAGIQEPCVPTSICVNPTGQFLAMGTDSNTIGLYDLKAGKMALEYKAHSNEVRSVRFNPVLPDLLLSSSYDGTIALTDVSGLISDADPSMHVEDHLSTIAKCGDKVIQCRWHPNGEDFASTSVDKTCKLWHRFGD